MAILKKPISAAAIIALFSINYCFAESAPLGISIGDGSDSSAAPSGLTNSTGQGNFTLRIHNKCFATNLRGLANPIAPTSAIKTALKMTVSGQKLDFWVSYMGEVAAQAGVVGAYSVKPITEKGTLTTTKTEYATCSPINVMNNANNNCAFGMGICGNNFGIGNNAAIGMGNNFGIGNIAIGIGNLNQVNYPAGCVKQPNGTYAKPYLVNVVIPYTNYSLPPGSRAGLYGNVVQLNINVPTAVAKNPDGTPTVKYPQPTLDSYSFTQKVTDCAQITAIYGTLGHSAHKPTYNCGAYMAKDGVVSAAISGFKVATDHSSADLYVNFPGQTGFCGGYYSPLMIYLSDARPTFDNISDFPLNNAGKTSWVEKNAPGFFLVLDKNGDGTINSREQLFGNSDENLNGFEQLAKFDLNRDHSIDHKDDIYKHLYLWNDKNGDGKSGKNELRTLQSMHIKISLSYKKDLVRPIGRNAEEREISKISYIKEGKVRTATISDIWLAPK